MAPDGRETRYRGADNSWNRTHRSRCVTRVERPGCRCLTRHRSTRRTMSREPTRRGRPRRCRPDLGMRPPRALRPPSRPASRPSLPSRPAGLPSSPARRTGRPMNRTTPARRNTRPRTYCPNRRHRPMRRWLDPPCLALHWRRRRRGRRPRSPPRQSRRNQSHRDQSRRDQSRRHLSRHRPTRRWCGHPFPSRHHPPTPPWPGRPCPGCRLPRPPIRPGDARCHPRTRHHRPTRPGGARCHRRTRHGHRHRHRHRDGHLLTRRSPAQRCHAYPPRPARPVRLACPSRRRPMATRR